MIDAFWQALETYDLDEVTVSMVTSSADCNRGSFYYHFSSLQDLTRAAFNRDCVNRDGVARALLSFASGKHVEATHVIFDEERVRKMGLIGERGGAAIAGSGTCDALSSVWSAIACAAGEPYSVSARNAVDFVNYGIARFVNTACHADPLCRDIDASAIFLRDLTIFTLHEIARFQNISDEEAVARLKRLVEGR